MPTNTGNLPTARNKFVSTSADDRYKHKRLPPSFGQAKYKNRYKVKLILSYILRKTASRGGLFCCWERDPAKQIIFSARDEVRQYILYPPAQSVRRHRAAGEEVLQCGVLCYHILPHGMEHMKANPGFSNLSLSEAVVTLQPRCVQIGDIMRSSPSSERVT